MELFQKTRRNGWRIFRLLGLPIFAYHKSPVRSFSHPDCEVLGRRVLLIDAGTRKGPPRDGLFAIVNRVLAWIQYADEHGLVPIVDLTTHPSVYCSIGVKPDNDPWTVFFEQPGGIPLQKGLRARHGFVTIARPDYDAMPNIEMDFYDDTDGVLTHWRDTVSRFLRPSEEVRARVDAFVRDSGIDFARTVGVLSRGTDYMKVRPAGHPIQPEAAAIITDVQKVLLGGSYNRVFLVSEDANIVDCFKEAFGEKLIMAPQQSVRYSGGYLADSDAVANNVEMGVAYLVSVLILARCHAIIAGRTSGSVAAAYFSKGFDYQKFYDIGKYEWRSKS